MQSLNPSSTVVLNDGVAMPVFGLGVWQMDDAAAALSVREGLAAGYRLIDTASVYGNERGVGEGLHDAGVPRENVFVTTKVWNIDQGRAATERSIQDSLQRMGLSYLDLVLIHWPAAAMGLFVETWATLIALRDTGTVRSIGVSNFNATHLDAIETATGVRPAVNQIELHPYLQQDELRRTHHAHGIVTQSWSPLAQGDALTDPAIRQLASKHGRTPAQVIIRWHLQSGLAVIPKSAKPERLRENLGAFDFALDANDMQTLMLLDDGRRLGPDPDTFVDNPAS